MTKRHFTPGMRVTREDGRSGTLLRRTTGYAEWLVELDPESVYPPGKGDRLKWWAERDMREDST